MLKSIFKVPSMHISIDVAVLLLRIGFSILMLTHGYPKLLKAINGDFNFGDPLGLGSSLSLLLTIFAEVFCSLLLIIGLFTRPALLCLIFTMFVAAFIVHGDDGLGKMEKALLYLVAYLAMFIIGPGRISMDRRLTKKWFG